jgi:uncharacterized protein (TIGR03067 family)
LSDVGQNNIGSFSVEKCNEKAEVKRNLITEEIAKFQGSWQQISSETGGVKDQPDEFGSAPRVAFVGNRYVVRRADDTIVIKGRFRVHPAQTPKGIDWMDTIGADAGRTLPAIYTLEDDQLLFCAADHGQPRPSEFCSAPGQVLRLHRRLSKL